MRCTGVKSPERAWDFCVPVFLTEASELIEYAAREMDIGLELIKMGLAWHDPRYAPKAKEYAEAEAEARKEKRGLWSDDKPVAPWDWRKQQNDDADEDD